MESKKTEKKKEVESLVPLYRSQKNSLQKPRLNLWFKKKINFDYTVGLVCEYGNKYNL